MSSVPVPIEQLSAVKTYYKEMLFDEGFKPTRLVVMVGAADFFGTRAGASPRTYPIELVRLFNYLKSIGAFSQKAIDEKQTTIVLAFDKFYDVSLINNDMDQLNDLLLAKLPKKVKAEVLANGENWKYNTDHFFFDTAYNDRKTWPMQYSYKELLHIGFFNSSLETSYNDHDLFELIFGTTTFQNIVTKCVPQENTLMAALQQFCGAFPFEEYYLYNCAWIGGTRVFQKEGKIYGNTDKQNRYYEGMCELLHIFRNLTKPAYLLSEADMTAFTHKNQEKAKFEANSLREFAITYEMTGKSEHNVVLYKTPLNETTAFKKKEKKATRGGNKTKKRKSSSRK